MGRRIAIIGSAPSSIQLVPWHDQTLELWACSPGAAGHLKRVDRFFELHRWEPGKAWFPVDYMTWLANCRCPVYVFDMAMAPTVKTAELYPKEPMVQRFGPWFFTSSVAWMLAMAISEGVSEIYFYGVDMSADEEVYSQQKAGCHFFISVARAMGIRVIAPPESDLMRPTRLYGYCELDPMHIKLLVRSQEYKDRLAAKQVEAQRAHEEICFLQGCLADNEYHLKTWVTDQQSEQMAYWNPDLKPDPEPINWDKVDLAEIQPQPPEFEPRRTRKKTNGHSPEVVDVDG